MAGAQRGGPPDLPIPRRRYLPRRVLWNRAVVYAQRVVDLARRRSTSPG